MSETGINRKGFFCRLLCRHKNTGKFTKQSESGFVCISGETVLTICKDCGKVLHKTFYEYEGNGYK